LRGVAQFCPRICGARRLGRRVGKIARGCDIIIAVPGNLAHPEGIGFSLAATAWAKLCDAAQTWSPCRAILPTLLDLTP
jgi:hypothetical protein